MYHILYTGRYKIARSRAHSCPEVEGIEQRPEPIGYQPEAYAHHHIAHHVDQGDIVSAVHLALKGKFGAQVSYPSSTLIHIVGGTKVEQRLLQIVEYGPR